MDLCQLAARDQPVDHGAPTRQLACCLWNGKKQRLVYHRRHRSDQRERCEVAALLPSSTSTMRPHDLAYKSHYANPVAESSASAAAISPSSPQRSAFQTSCAISLEFA